MSTIQDYKRDILLFFQPYDLRLVIVGVKLRPNISLSACPWSANLTSFATIAALTLTWFISFGLLHRRFASCSLRRLESNAMPHSWKSLFLSSSENLFCISLPSTSLSRRRAFILLPNKNVGLSFMLMYQ